MSGVFLSVIIVAHEASVMAWQEWLSNQVLWIGNLKGLVCTLPLL